MIGRMVGPGVHSIWSGKRRIAVCIKTLHASDHWLQPQPSRRHLQELLLSHGMVCFAPVQRLCLGCGCVRMRLRSSRYNYIIPKPTKLGPASLLAPHCYKPAFLNINLPLMELLSVPSSEGLLWPRHLSKPAGVLTTVQTCVYKHRQSTLEDLRCTVCTYRVFV